MKTIYGSLILLAVLAGSAYAAPRLKVPHLESDMTSAEYHQLLQERSRVSGKTAEETDPELAAILKLGKRNIDWLAKVNAERAPETQLPLSTPETQRAYPVDAPSVSSPSLIKGRLLDLKKVMPEDMQKVLFDDSAALPADTANVADDMFLQNVRDLDRIYQSASRWLLQVPDLDEYKKGSVYDVRGYFHLKKIKHLGFKLRAWHVLKAKEREVLRGHLINVCHNSEIERRVCQGELEKSERKLLGVYKFYKKYWSAAEKLWASYFEIPKVRPEVEWDSNDPGKLIFPFKDPSNEAVAKWFEENVEDEWRWKDWHLDIQYTAEEGPFAHIVFKEGATPHVNDIAGDTITMDANRSIQEYSSRWIIRHEYGHVIGFPDCYVEFFDTEMDAMVNYQLDITNLMCSRRGKFKQVHFDELKRAYFKDIRAQVN